MEEGIEGHGHRASELETVPILSKKSGAGKGGVKRRVVDAHALREKANAYPLTRDVVKGAPEIGSCKQLDVLEFIGLG